MHAIIAVGLVVLGAAVGSLIAATHYHMGAETVTRLVTEALEAAEERDAADAAAGAVEGPHSRAGYPQRTLFDLPVDGGYGEARAPVGDQYHSSPAAGRRHPGGAQWPSDPAA